MKVPDGVGEGDEPIRLEEDHPDQVDRPTRLQLR